MKSKKPKLIIPSKTFAEWWEEEVGDEEETCRPKFFPRADWKELLRLTKDMSRHAWKASKRQTFEQAIRLVEIRAEDAHEIAQSDLGGTMSELEKLQLQADTTAALMRLQAMAVDR